MESISPENAVAKTITPILLIHGRDDGNIPFRHSQRIITRNRHVVLWRFLAPTIAAQSAPIQMNSRHDSWLGFENKGESGCLGRGNSHGVADVKQSNIGWSRLKGAYYFWITVKTCDPITALSMRFRQREFRLHPHARIPGRSISPRTFAPQTLESPFHQTRPYRRALYPCRRNPTLAQ